MSDTDSPQEPADVPLAAGDRGDRAAAEPAPPEAPAAPVLQYASAVDHGMVTIARCADLAEAEMIAGELGAEGIRCTVTNTLAAAMGPWGGGARVYVDVPKQEADRAAAVLRVRTLGDDVEPADDDAEDVGGTSAADGEVDPPLDEEGRPVPLVVVAAYDTASRMRDAVTTLGSARIRCVVPRLVPLGDRPRGEGNRFTVRVGADDLARARAVLHGPAEKSGADRDADGDAGDDEEVRCPACSSWRVHRLGSLWVNVGRFFGLVGGSEKSDPFQCLACGHKWLPGTNGPAGT
jgi:DNA-directed RNA polymerase subunit RPC12/RpoP